jgi:hypothetical protein
LNKLLSIFNLLNWNRKLSLPIRFLSSKPIQCRARGVFGSRVTTRDSALRPGDRPVFVRNHLVFNHEDNQTAEQISRAFDRINDPIGLQRVERRLVRFHGRRRQIRRRCVLNISLPIHLLQYSKLFLDNLVEFFVFLTDG